MAWIIWLLSGNVFGIAGIFTESVQKESVYIIFCFALSCNSKRNVKIYKNIVFFCIYATFMRSKMTFYTRKIKRKQFFFFSGKLIMRFITVCFA